MTKLNVFVILDASGSMEHIESNMKSGLKAFAEGLVTSKIDADVTVVAFSHNPLLAQDPKGIFLNDLAVSTPVAEFVKNYKQVMSNFVPEGGTPLYEAITGLESRIAANGGSKAVIVIATDGDAGNYGVTAKDAGAALTRLQDKGYQAVYLGMQFDPSNGCSALGIGYSRSLAIKNGKYEVAFSALAENSVRYATQNRPLVFSEYDRERAGTPTPKQVIEDVAL